MVVSLELRQAENGRTNDFIVLSIKIMDTISYEKKYENTLGFLLVFNHL
jgi:hypothetical protein